MVHIEDEGGRGVLTFVPTRAYQTLVFSSPDLQRGATYVVCSGGSATGSQVDGVYYDGEYTGGEEFTRLTIADVVTFAGSQPGGMSGGFGRVPGRR